MNGSSINNNGTYFFDDNSVLKYLRKVLAEINPDYVDCGIRCAFILKRYIERYKIFDDSKRGPRLALLCMLKDIGTYYKSGEIPRSNHALAAASSYAFMHNCSPFGTEAKPLLFYQSKYLEDTDDIDQQAGLLMSLVNQIVEYNYQEYTIEEMEGLIKKDKRGIFNPEQIKKMFKLLKEQKDIYELLNDKNSLYIYEASKYISSADYSVDELLAFIDMATFSFEFHNNETLAHTVTVAAISEELARLSRLPDDMIAEIRLASLVHDIGKIRVPLEILCYPGKLSDEMFAQMKKHVEYTRDIITGCFSFKIVDIASHHHEKLDGSGYPDHLRERDLSVGDKIIAVADIASALYCKRSYKGAFDEDKIKAIIKSDMEKGQLDRRIVNHLFNNWDTIIDEMKIVEKNVLDQYAAMRKEYEALSNSKALFQLFDYEDTYKSIFDDRVEYVDEEGNPLTKQEVEELKAQGVISEDGEVVEEEAIEAQEETTEEVIEEELEEVTKEVIEESSLNDLEDFEAYANSLEEKDEESEEAESEESVDDNEDIETEESDLDFEAYANSLEEKDESEEVESEDEEETEDEDLESDEDDDFEDDEEESDDSDLDEDSNDTATDDDFLAYVEGIKEKEEESKVEETEEPVDDNLDEESESLRDKVINSVGEPSLDRCLNQLNELLQKNVISSLNYEINDSMIDGALIWTAECVVEVNEQSFKSISRDQTKKNAKKQASLKMMEILTEE